jgi:hypothetical protein
MGLFLKGGGTSIRSLLTLMFTGITDCSIWNVRAVVNRAVVNSEQAALRVFFCTTYMAAQRITGLCLQRTGFFGGPMV